MAHAISSATQADATTASATQTQPVAKTATSSAKATQSPSKTPTDTVQISSAAKAALQEALETPAQTATEARSGDHQAQRLLAKEAAAKKA